MAWESIAGKSAGQMNGDGSRKLLLHTTEGPTVEGAVAAYRANNSWPHLTVDCKRRRVVQHLPLGVAARSLRNTPGGADETNRDGTVLVQIEIVGTAVGPAIGDRDDLVWFGREVVGPVCEAQSIPLTSTVRWAPYPQSYGADAAQRLSVAAWDAYSGLLGHQHAPDNLHGDPGAIDIDLILSAARGDEETDMTPQEHEVLYTLNNQVVNAVLPKLNALSAAVAKLTGADVDEAALAAELAPLLPDQLHTLSDGDVERIAVAAANENARRQAE